MAMAFPGPVERELLYRKIGDNRYETIPSIADGTYLMTVSYSLVSYSSKILPELAPVYAALEQAEDTIAQALSDASRFKIDSRTPLSVEQSTDWEAFIAKHGDEFRYLAHPSAHVVARDATDRIRHWVEKAHANPAVRDAYDHYKFLVQLTLSETQ